MYCGEEAWEQLSEVEQEAITEKVKNEFCTLASKITEELKASFPHMIIHEELTSSF